MACPRLPAVMTRSPWKIHHIYSWKGKPEMDITTLKLLDAEIVPTSCVPRGVGRWECRVGFLCVIVISRAFHGTRFCAFHYQTWGCSATRLIVFVGETSVICWRRHGSFSICDVLLSQKSGDVIFPLSSTWSWVSHRLPIFLFSRRDVSTVYYSITAFMFDFEVSNHAFIP